MVTHKSQTIKLAKRNSIESFSRQNRKLLRMNKFKHKKKYRFNSISQIDTGKKPISCFKDEVTGVALDNARKVHHYIVEVNLMFNKIGEIDTMNGKFYAEILIEAIWYDPCLIQSDNFKYNPKEDWNPELYIINIKDDLKERVWYTEKYGQQLKSQAKDTLKSVSSCDLDLPINGYTITERRHIQGTFWQKLNLTDFPADIQSLKLIVSTLHDSNRISIIHNMEKLSVLNINCFLDHQEWNLFNIVKVNEEIQRNFLLNETIPCIEFIVHVARKPSFYYWNAFFLILLIAISSLTIFSMKCHLTHNRLQTGCTLLLTSVTFKWITNRSLPTTSYMTTWDQYSLFCIVIICLECLWHGVIGAFIPHDQVCIHDFLKYDFIAFIVFIALIVVLNVYYFYIFIRIWFYKNKEMKSQERTYANIIIEKKATRLRSIMLK